MGWRWLGVMETSASTPSTATNRLRQPYSSLLSAIRYALDNWSELTRFLDDVHVPPDNNRSEAALRVAALGRKNFLFVGHENAGDNVAALYTLVATCEAHGVKAITADAVKLLASTGTAIEVPALVRQPVDLGAYDALLAEVGT